MILTATAAAILIAFILPNQSLVILTLDAGEGDGRVMVPECSGARSGRRIVAHRVTDN